MQAFNLLAKVFVKRHKNFLRLTSRRSGWTAYRNAVRSWNQIEDLLPPTTLEKNIVNFGLFYDAVFEILLEKDRRKKYEATRYKKNKKLKLAKAKRSRL